MLTIQRPSNRILTFPPGAMEVRSAGGGGVAAFVATDYPNLTLWVAGRQIIGLNDGDAMATWVDFSGLGNTLTQSTPAYRPTYKTSIVNGLAVARCTSNGQMIAPGTLATYMTATTGSIYVVTSKAAASNSSLFNSLGYKDLRYATGTPDQWQFYNWDGTADIAALTATLSQFIVLAAWHGDGNINLSINGGIPATTASGATTSTTPSINVGRWYSGDIAEVAIYSVAHTPVQRAAAIAALMATYGIV